MVEVSKKICWVSIGRPEVVDEKQTLHVLKPATCVRKCLSQCRRVFHPCNTCSTSRRLHSLHNFLNIDLNCCLLSETHVLDAVREALANVSVTGEALQRNCLPGPRHTDSTVGGMELSRSRRGFFS